VRMLQMNAVDRVELCATLCMPWHSNNMP
jgi:hypothetical protein